MRSKNGWLPPPRPIYVSPSFDSSDSDQETRWKILIDWAHDDDLKDFISSSPANMLWFFGGAGLTKTNMLGQHDLTLFPTDTLIAFYFLGPTPSANDLADWCIKYELLIPPDAGDAGQSVVFQNVAGAVTIPTFLPVAWVTAWHSLDDLLTNIVIPKRAALGPLESNVFLNDDGSDLADSIVINYYDDNWIKRVTYPKATIAAASQKPQWWNLPNVTIEQWGSNGTDILGDRSPAASSDPNAGWYQDGWDITKNSGAFFDIMHVVVAVLAAVLSATGIGAVFTVIITSILTIVIDVLQAAADAIEGGNPIAAIYNLGQAMLAIGTSELTQLSNAGYSGLAKLGTSGLKLLGTTLTKIGTDLSPQTVGQTLTLQDELNLLTQNAAQYSTITLDQFNAVLELVSGNGSVNVPLAQSGWDIAQYADTNDVLGVGKIYQDNFPGPAAGIWRLGAHLGTLARAQTGGAVLNSSPPTINPNLLVLLMAPFRTNILPNAIIFTPMYDLMNYVRGILAPRYNIRS